MRKITKKITKSFMARQSDTSGNTMTDGQALFLHGNKIAEHRSSDLWINDCGWPSRTTHDRLNALPGVSVTQLKGKSFLNGKEWDGKWTKI